MNRLSASHRARIVRCLAEGNSLRATAEICDCAYNTVVKLVLDVGAVCAAYQDATVRGLATTHLKVDENCNSGGCKRKHVTIERRATGQGGPCTWTAIDADSRLMITWLLGNGSESDCRIFFDDLADRLTMRLELPGECPGTYRDGVKLILGSNVDYGLIVKVFGQDLSEKKRKGPVSSTSPDSECFLADPIDQLISIPNMERQNLKFRKSCPHFTRSTNVSLEKFEKHSAAFALFGMFYNFCRPHKTLTKKTSALEGNNAPTTPAMAAGLAEHPWSVEELLAAILSN